MIRNIKGTIHAVKETIKLIWREGKDFRTIHAILSPNGTYEEFETGEVVKGNIYSMLKNAYMHGCELTIEDISRVY